MRCLAVNTANTTLSVSIVDGEKELFSFDTGETRDQGNLLLMHIREGLKKAGLDFKDLDLLAVVTGPGSFTGIRIGLAAMRGISLASGVPLIGISSFDLFACQRPDMKNVIAIESWREELYFQLEGSEPVNLSPSDFGALVGTGDFILSGDAKEKAAPFFKAAQMDDRKITGKDMARIAVQKFGRNKTPERPVPFYLRDADVSFSANKPRKVTS